MPFGQGYLTIRTLPHIVALAVALGAVSSGSGATARPNRALTTGQLKLETLPYSKARTIILSYGWTPTHGACAEAAGDEPATCAKFPEIDTCLSSYPNMCIMRFEKDGKSLVVTTRYGPPSASDEGDTRVWNIDFITKKGLRIGGR